MMKDISQECTRILDVIRSNTRFILTSHINPDGDGLGSELAMYYLLKQYEKEVTIINASPVPAVYRFMDPEGTLFKQYGEGDSEVIRNADVIFVLDISEMSRLGPVGGAIEKSSALRICIDHHSTNNFPGDISLIDEKAVATGELITQIVKQSDVGLTNKIAEALYITLLTDTGCFRFSNTNATAHRLSAEFLDLGINHTQIYNNIFENDSWEKTGLFARAIATLEKHAEGKIATIQVTREMLVQTGASYEDIEGFAEFPRNIKGVLISILFVEHPGERVKISFRSRQGVLVDALAAEFGGGGHRSASAVALDDTPLREAQTKILHVAEKYV